MQEDKYTTSLMENVITILAYDKVEGKLVSQLLKPNLMEGDYRIVATRCIDYWRRYKKPPGAHLGDLFSDILDVKGDRRAPMLKRTLTAMQRLSGSVNTKYVIDQLRSVHRTQRIKATIVESAEKINAQDYMAVEEVEEMWQKILREQEQDFNSGTELRDVRKVFDRIRTVTDEFSTGIKELDKRGIRPQRGTLMMYVAPPGRGKCLARGTPVIMHDASVVPVESIKRGDFVMGPDGSPRKVLNTVTGHDKMFRIVPNKGDAWVCNSAHILSLVMTTDGVRDYFDMPLDDFMRKPASWRRHCKLFTPSEPLVFPPKNNPEFDPYLLGLWIANGTKNLFQYSTRTDVMKTDSEVLEACSILAETFGLHVPVKRRAVLLHYLKPFTSDERGSEFLQKLLTTSVEYRKHLLAGIIDAGGSLRNNCFELVQKRFQISDKIMFLARSLGLRATQSVKFVNGSEYACLRFFGDVSLVPTRLPGKQAKPRRHIKCANHSGFTVESLDIGRYYGFNLGGDGRFLLGDFTVTHNSWWMISTAKRALLDRKKVVFVSLEMDEEDVLARMYQAMMSLPVTGDDFEITTIKKRLGKVTGLERKTMRPQFHFGSKTIELEINSYLDQLGRKADNFVVKRFVPGQLTGAGLRAYLDSLEQGGFIPDMVVVDYLGIMKVDPRNLRISMGQNAVELRAVAIERNIAMVAAHQASKAGEEAMTVKTTHMAEDFSIVGTADWILTYSCSEREFAHGLGRLFVGKARRRKDRWGVLITQSYDIGQFCLSSMFLDSSYFEHLEELTADNDADDVPDDNDD